MEVVRVTLVGLAIAALVAGSAWGQGDTAQNAAQATNAFAVDLYRALKPGGENLLVSPYSVAVALHMARGGARGKTAEEMARALHVAPLDSHEGIAALMARLEKGEHAGYRLHVANSLWAQKGLKVEDAFLRLLRESYRSDLCRANFATGAEDARQAINEWVEGKTRDRIKNLVSPGVLNELTRMVLVNALYFKAGWDNEFPERSTRDAEFWTAQDVAVSCRMMENVGYICYAEDDHVQVLELPYRGGEMSMVFVLPRSRTGLADLESGLNRDRMSAWCSNLSNRFLVVINIPKFKISSTFQLRSTLKNLGVVRAFSLEEADFRGITRAEPLFLQEALHRTWIAVDEKGTEAAGATALVADGAAMKIEYRAFLADHPFLFFIRHRESGAILFMGRVVKPEAAGG